MRLLIGTIIVTVSNTTSAVKTAAAVISQAPDATIAATINTTNVAMYQNGITLPSTRLPSLRARRYASSGSRSKIGLVKAATAISTPTIGPVIVRATMLTMSSTSSTLAVMLTKNKVLTN